LCLLTSSTHKTHMLFKPLWIIGVLALLGVVASVIGTAIMKKKTKARNKDRASQACGTNPEARVPIFVMMVAVGDQHTSAAIKTLASVYGNAACPLRVFTGLADYYDSGASHAACALAAKFAKFADASTIPFKVGDNVRALRVPVAEFPGSLVALEQVQRFLYRGEVYILLVEPGVVLAAQWDVTLMLAIEAAPGRSVVSMRPPPPGTPGTVGTYLAVATARFPRFVAFNMKTPVEGELPPVVPALGWSSALSFSKGPLPLGDAAAMVSSGVGPDMAMTARMLLTGWVLQHPCARVATMIPAPAPETAFASTSAMLHPAVAEHLGLDMVHDTVSARGRLGLVPGKNPPSELAAKVGSSGDVLSMLSRIETSHHKRQKSPE
jgi:hypothetical protein